MTNRVWALIHLGFALVAAVLFSLWIAGNDRYLWLFVVVAWLLIRGFMFDLFVAVEYSKKGSRDLTT